MIILVGRSKSSATCIMISYELFSMFPREFEQL